MNAIRITIPLMKNLAYMNDSDIINHDIKAEKILITNDSKIQIADFGLARSLNVVHSNYYFLYRIFWTKEYWIPEVLTRETFGKPVEQWGWSSSQHISLSISLKFKLNGKKKGSICIWDEWCEANGGHRKCNGKYAFFASDATATTTKRCTAFDNSGNFRPSRIFANYICETFATPDHMLKALSHKVAPNYGNHRLPKAHSFLPSSRHLQ